MSCAAGEKDEAFAGACGAHLVLWRGPGGTDGFGNERMFDNFQGRMRLKRFEVVDI